jgi:hypothetical protein
METIFEYVLAELKNELHELNIRAALKALKTPKLGKSREARRAVTQKKLELKRYKDKLKVKKEVAKRRQAMKRSSAPIKVYSKPVKRIEFKPKVIEFKPRS